MAGVGLDEFEGPFHPNHSMSPCWKGPSSPTCSKLRLLHEDLDAPRVFLWENIYSIRFLNPSKGSSKDGTKPVWDSGTWRWSIQTIPEKTTKDPFSQHFSPEEFLKCPKRPQQRSLEGSRMRNKRSEINRIQIQPQPFLNQIQPEELNSLCHHAPGWEFLYQSIKILENNQILPKKSLNSRRKRPIFDLFFTINDVAQLYFSKWKMLCKWCKSFFFF